MSLVRIHDYVINLHFDWRSISLLISIEKFNVQWSSIWQQESMIFENGCDITSYELFLAHAEERISSTHPKIFEDLESLKLWFDTEPEIHPLVKCLLFGYIMQQVFTLHNDYSGLDLQVIIVLLFESGYTWVKHINLPLLLSSNIEDWLRSLLSSLIDEQQLLLRKLDLYGVKSKLTLKEQLLLHIIETNAGIKTTAIARKAGCHVQR
jgi:hypothetical protein